MTQQQSLSAAELSCLEKQHEEKRIETLKALEALNTVRRHALMELQKTRILFKYLNWKQQERIENLCGSSFSLQKINLLHAFFSASVYSGIAENSLVPAAPQGPASYLQRVKTARKNIVQFGVIEARVHELIAAIAKSAAVFKHQYKTAYGELFPLGFISKAVRRVRQIFHRPFYSWQEIGCLANLGMAAGFVFKMAEAPVLGERR